MLIALLLVLGFLMGCATPPRAKELASLERQYFEKLNKRLEDQRKGVVDSLNDLKSAAVDDYMTIMDIWAIGLEKQNVVNKYKDAIKSNPSCVKKALMELTEIDFRYMFATGETGGRREILKDYNSLLQEYEKLIELSRKLARNSRALEGYLQAGSQLEVDKVMEYVKMPEWAEILSKFGKKDEVQK
ncbi:MAG: hypothetical protein QMD05_07975 [Candidatus Brocadiaceae bacterium]|nr:hypothetical protein [Candidatus Brocadiaceae bacterium]